MKLKFYFIYFKYILKHFTLLVILYDDEECCCGVLQSDLEHKLNQLVVEEEEEEGVGEEGAGEGGGGVGDCRVRSFHHAVPQVLFHCNHVTLCRFCLTFTCQNIVLSIFYLNK